MRKIVLLIAAAVIVIAAGVVMTREEVIIHETNQVFENAYRVESGTRVVLAKGSSLTVEGDLTVDGTLACDQGPLTVIVKGHLTVSGALECGRAEITKEKLQSDLSLSDFGITLVVAGGLTFEETAVVKTNSHVQIVRSEADLLKTTQEREALFNETALPTGTGPRIGPLINDASQASGAPTLQSQPTRSPIRIVETANAQEEPRDKEGNIIDNYIIRGRWFIGDGENPPKGLNIPTPPKGVDKIILNFNFGKGGKVQLEDFHLVGPDGASGESDTGKSCNAKGADGKDAMRFRVHAQSVKINVFRLELGNGGNGGGAETLKECDPGIATGGKGGEAGNMKITADNGIDIVSMHIVPGAGGAGGSAVALGKDGENGCPGKKGGDATATGGKGGDNKKELSATGSVKGMSNVSMADVIGGWAGDATAEPGKGGNGTGCNCKGGNGGKATANGGAGGKASIKSTTGAGGATGGNGGSADATGGAAGNGGHCPLKPNGGDGGKGGDATAKPGVGGTGTTKAGEDGTKIEIGGDGGNGGDGCLQGAGGPGGAAEQPGKPGLPGNLKCPGEEPKDEILVDPGYDNKPKDEEPTTGGTNKVDAIKYQGTYLLVSSLRIGGIHEVTASGGCPEQHWHADAPVKGLDGKMYSDPKPSSCGFCTLSQCPKVKVDAPKTQVQATSASAQLKASPSALSFVHRIGQTECPQTIGTVQVSGAPSWRVVSPNQMWLQTPPTGNGPLSATFTCELERYASQTLNAPIILQGLNPDGSPAGDPIQIPVSGQIIGQ